MALITGAASGIGRAIAHTFVREGCTRLILGDINFEGLSAVTEELKGLDADVQTCNVKCDTSSEEEVQSMIDQGVSMFGELHYAVNNAGITSNPRVRTHELSSEAWDKVHNVNLKGVWFCQRAEIRQMLKQEPSVSQRYGNKDTGQLTVNLLLF